MAAFLAVVMLVGSVGCTNTGLEGGAAGQNQPAEDGVVGPPPEDSVVGQPPEDSVVGQPPPSNLPPEIAGVHPLEGSQVSPRPQIGVDLNLTDAMRKAGSFDLSTVTLTLDGKDVTQEAQVLGTMTYPQSRASVLYTPTTALTLGTHRAAFTFPSASGRSTFEWTFTVANVPSSLPPEIAGVHPLDGSQVCPRPQIGVDLFLTGAMRQAGSFDLSTVKLTLDGKDVTQEAQVLSSMNYPPSRASLSYTPTTALALGTHRAAITFPSASGRSTIEWTFTVANVSCP
jgi:hypothetical protein